MEEKSQTEEMTRLRELNNNKLIEIDHEEQSNLSAEDLKEKAASGDPS
jgi:hypothetical protein